MLDLLSEDLNKVKGRKPYIPFESRGERDSKEEAERYWSEVFKKRNDSIISDIFYGLIKSTVTCSVCNTSSGTFENFNMLSLPINQKKLEVIYVPY